MNIFRIKKIYISPQRNLIDVTRLYLRTFSIVGVTVNCCGKYSPVPLNLTQNPLHLQYIYTFQRDTQCQVRCISNSQRVQAHISCTIPTNNSESSLIIQRVSIMKEIYEVHCLYYIVNGTIRLWNRLPAEILGTLPCKPNTFRKRVRKVVNVVN